MNRFLQAFISLALLLTANGASAAADQPGTYRLRSGDAVLISVWREDALQREVRVLPDGSITFPLAGRIEVNGLSAPEVEQRIAAKLKPYLPDPVVTVVVTGIEGNHVYVLGKVGKPGLMILNGPTTVLQALSMAGGLDKFADEGAIKLVRVEAGKQEILPVRYKDLISGRNMATNIQLRAGDTILVP